ncbi:MAG: two-component system sensor histidine kinase NtrB [Desulfosudaceae bacterium]
MKKILSSTGIPPLILIGSVLVLFPIFTYMTLDRIHRQKNQSIALLLEKSTALIRTFEAGTYTGMTHMDWNRTAMKNLLRETSALPDIVYLFVVKRDGTILVDSRENETNRQYDHNLDLAEVLASERIHWRIKENDPGPNVFEVYKAFTPVRQLRRPPLPGRMARHYQMHGRRLADLYRDTVIVVGLDMTPIEQAYQNDIQHSIVMGVILALIGFSGVILVFLVQRYTAARSSLSRMKIFSDNLVANMPVGMIAMDTHGRVVSVNPVTRTIFDIPTAVPPEEISAWLPAEVGQLWQIIVTKTSPLEKEIRLEVRAGHPMVLEVIASPLYDSEGAPMGGMILIRDKTELDRLRTEMESNRRFAAIGRLAAGVAHEIRNPLSALKGYAVVLKEVFDKSTENYRIADMITREADRLNRVVSDMGELARPINLTRKPVDLSTVIRDSLQLVTHETDLHNITVTTELDPDTPAVSADADKLRQVLLNLCLNAVQAMQKGGTLTLRLFPDPAGAAAIIEVADTGEGIEPANQQEIFEPYFTTKQSGTGLGLAVVRNIVQAHEGRIRVDSQPGHGTLIALTLPYENRKRHE